ncbi:hypothetical protein GCM10011491_18280 [Brucella endophytica]|uniref:Phytase-like domain-containing protein n=1 Tax=Brucella endophytica TaxID=1963359 RepID=A0A916S9S1_9HYPH|nr:esterase-like activity of phytase family protein [Brucella endophytica]GGA90689.1 hypothetical protein GCM10011491_18280 [Brucella endophytica]
MKVSFLCAAVLTLVSVSTGALAQDFTKAELLGELILPTGLKIAGVEFGGISGLDYDRTNNLYYAISDDRSEKAPARFYTLKVALNSEGIHGIDIVTATTLLNAAGHPFAAKDVDPESIRFNSATNTIYWTSEGDQKGTPAIRESRLDGTLLREFKLPDTYLPNEDKTRGIRNNLSFESLTISSDGKTLLVGTENALVQDGGMATLSEGSRARIIAFDISSGEVKAEYAYDTGPVFAQATQVPFWNDNGLSEFAAWGDDLLTVERSYAHGVGNAINLYRVRFDNATNIMNTGFLKSVSLVPVKKEPVLHLGEGDFGLDIDNIEAVTWGPVIGNRKIILIASDNNFSSAQRTQFAVFLLGE